jgi:hypothetical protein
LRHAGVESSHYIHLYRIKQSLKKTELLDQVVKKTGVTKVMADKVLSAVTDSIAESLADGKKGKCEEGKRGKSTERLCDEREGIEGGICILLELTFSCSGVRNAQAIGQRERDEPTSTSSLFHPLLSHQNLH